MSYTIVLVVLAIRAQERGNSAWTTGVRDGVLFYSVRKTTGGAAQVQTALATIPYSLPPPQQPPTSGFATTSATTGLSRLPLVLSNCTGVRSRPREALVCLWTVFPSLPRPG
jgi:hypothetical protein